MPDQTKYTTKLHNTRILIIGGTSGLGYALAEAVLEHGAFVTISSSNPTRIQTALTSLQTSYPSITTATPNRLHGLPVNLSNPSTLETELQTLLQKTIAQYDGAKLDHVIFTAGDALSILKLSDLSLEAIHTAGQIRFFAPLLLAKHLPSYMNPTPQSSYTITTGSISEKPIPDWSVIAAYSAGHHGMVRNLAVDLKPIRVNGVSPGVVDTELWRMGEEERRAFLEMSAGKMVTGRVGRREDVAESFLACLRDGNMSGSVVRSDGGVMLL